MKPVEVAANAEDANVVVKHESEEGGVNMLLKREGENLELTVGFKDSRTFFIIFPPADEQSAAEISSLTHACHCFSDFLMEFVTKKQLQVAEAVARENFSNRIESFDVYGVNDVLNEIYRIGKRVALLLNFRMPSLTLFFRRGIHNKSETVKIFSAVILEMEKSISAYMASGNKENLEDLTLRMKEIIFWLRRFVESLANEIRLDERSLD